MANFDRRFKAWVVDFDGTLVDANFNLSPKIKDSINNLIKEGVIFSIATGRPYQGVVKKICEELNLSSPQIVSGGAEIIDPKTDKILWYEYFSAQSAKNLINHFLKDRFDFTVESEGKVYTINGVDKSIGYGPNISFKDLEGLNYEKIAKIVLFSIISMGDPQTLEDKFNKIFPDLHFIRSGNGSGIVLDITSEKATKHLAVLELSTILNIDPDFMVGVGDGHNDFPLLSVCGYKIVMENAPKELKDIADLIVPDVKNDGLVVAINKLNL